MRTNDKPYHTKAAKKTKVNLTNTYRKPPVIPDEPGSLGLRTITLEGMPGYVSDHNQTYDHVEVEN